MSSLMKLAVLQILMFCRRDLALERLCTQELQSVRTTSAPASSASFNRRRAMAIEFLG
jgi:hypothetical protein